MKKALLIVLCCSGIGNYTIAQNAIDKYLTGTNNFKIVGGASDGLLNPQDLDFEPGTDTWWVLNYEGNTGSVSIFFDANKSTQTSDFRRDSHAGHFMIRASALAIGDNGNFATVHEIQNTNSASPTFMGPALWSTDTTIFARMHQSNWDPNKPLGSHLDMLHQSPFAMGIAHDNGNTYWVFDGYNNNICKYSFSAPHVVGGDDHADGEIYRYSDVTVKRKTGVPSHMVLDKQNNWLYIVDGGNNRIIRMKTNDATDAGGLTVPSTAGEPLAKYRNMTGATMEVLVSSGLTSPCGIDYKDNRIVVTDNATGEIIIYDVSSAPATEVGRIQTDAGIMGVRIDWDNGIWFVNRNKRQLVKIENANVPTSIAGMASEANLHVYPVPAHNVLNVEWDGEEAMVMLVDVAGRNVYQDKTDKSKLTINTSTLSLGVYTLVLRTERQVITRKVLIE
ncbi:MAG: T9SS type A sorting domain-containing protein [Candidatus Kuenenia stuttgartiensis]|nr:T9SS type A sorting domain-containing protein [Candidatus Kuenenia stuttgartiensis]